jgi:tRNA1Val (adenine37-N6)-methyltransferase
MITMAFRFKQFIVEDDRSSMRVGTDAVLLGSWINPENASEILDIGTGCGILALMMAQKSPAYITAIDIDEVSANQASLNFQQSIWDKRLKILHLSFQDFVKHHQDQFDLILTNPPWFSNSLKSPRNIRNIARHDDHLKPRDLFEGVKKILRGNGRFYIIIPADDQSSIVEIAGENNLFLNRQMMVIPKPGRKPKRILMDFTFSSPDHIITEEMIIRREDNSFTNEYRKLTGDYYLEF